MNDYSKYGEYSQQSSSSDGGFSLSSALAFIAIGAGIGAAISLLLAPRSGREIREAVRGGLDDARRSVQAQTSNLRRRGSAMIGQVRDKVQPITRTQ